MTTGIAGQLVAGTITEQVIELAEAWKLERRGYHGRWAESGTVAPEISSIGPRPAPDLGRAPMAGIGSRVQAATRQRAERQQRILAAHMSENKAAAVAAQAQGQLMSEKQMRAIASQVAENRAAAVENQVLTKVHDLKHEWDHADNEKKKKKAAIEIGLALGGGALVAGGTAIGVSPILAALLAAIPFVIQPIIEYFKKV